MLDTTKTYIGLSFGDGLISELIEHMEMGGDSIKGEKASHVLGLVYEDDWYVYEAVFPLVRKLKLTDFEKKTDSKTTVIFKEFNLNLNSLKYYYNFKRCYPYDVRNLFYRLLDRVPLLKNQDTKNLICSNYMARCQSDYEVCYKNNIPFDTITPAMIQEFTNDKPISYSINLKEEK